MRTDFRNRFQAAVWRLTSIAAVLSVTVLLGNQFLVQRQMREVLAQSERNSVVTMEAHFRHYVNPRELVLDLRELTERATPNDVVRVLIQYAQAQREQRFERVYFAHRGVEKFWMLGVDFQSLGAQALTREPLTILTTLPSHLHRPDGVKAFAASTSSPLEDMAQRLESYRLMHEQWYLQDLRLDGV
jgi:hypothetical protein